MTGWAITYAICAVVLPFYAYAFVRAYVIDWREYNRGRLIVANLRRIFRI